MTDTVIELHPKWWVMPIAANDDFLPDLDVNEFVSIKEEDPQLHAWIIENDGSKEYLSVHAKAAGYSNVKTFLILREWEQDHVLPVPMAISIAREHHEHLEFYTLRF